MIEADEARQALADGAIEPWFQPQVELLNGRVLAVEVLARWNRDGHVVRPMQFVPVLERAGLGRELTDAMLVQACRWKRHWDQSDLRLQVAVNVSHATLVDPAVADHFQALVKAHGVEPGAIMFEITESALMADRGAVGARAPAAERLRSVDRRFRHRLFLAGAAVRSAVHRAQDRSRLRLRRTAATTQARGDRGQPRAGAQAQARRRRRRRRNRRGMADALGIGLRLAQGFLVSRPVPGAELPEVIARWRRP